MTRKILPLAALIIFCSSFNLHNSGVFIAKNSTISFFSKTGMQNIRAKSIDCKGSVDIHKRTFSFTIPMGSFQGFDNALQKRHFCEKFADCIKFPDSGFKGKIIEDINLSVPGTYTVRGKGILSIHGVDQERIIDTQVVVKDGEVTIDSKFPIALADHNIKITKMASTVIAKIVNVEVKISMTPS